MQVIPPATVTRLLNAGACAVLGLFAVTVVVAFFTPVYFDDIGYTLSNARAGYDGWATISPMPLCSTNFVTPVPLTLLPGRWLAWMAHVLTTDFIAMRMIALLVFLGWCACAAWLVKRVFLPHLSWPCAAAAVAAVAGMGVVPLMMMQSRPEAALLLAITALVALPFLCRRLPENRACFWLCTLALLLTCSWFFSAHPKALLYLPLALAVCFYLPAPRSCLRVAALVAVLCVAGQAYHYWQYKVACPDHPSEQRFRDAQALRLEQFFADPARLLHSFAGNVGAAGTYIDKMRFHPDSDWATPLASGALMGPVNIIIAVTAAALLLFAGVGAARLIYGMLARRKWGAGEVVLCSLAAGLVAQSGLQTTKIFYESCMIWPGLFLLAGLAARAWRPAVQNLFLAWLFAASLVSQATLALVYIPATAEVLDNVSYNGTVMGKSTTVSPLGYGEIMERTLALAQQCGIAPDSRSRHVFVDVTTYLPMKETTQPYYGIYTLFGLQKTGQGLLDFLREHGSSGIVALCSNLTPEARDAALQEHGLCCVGPQQLAKTRH